jgi:3-phenylpropionate/trans-cinnamate dioxygenase ferredoxin reductase component
MAAGVERVVIVGAGACGGRAAEALREAGHDGAITLVGDEDHPPYERPPLSKAAITGREPASPATLFAGGRLAELGVELVAGVAAAAIDRDHRAVVLADGRSLPYDRLLLATGARPRPLPVPGGDAALLLRTVADAEEIRTQLSNGGHVVIIGGGFIGLELAASARAWGCQVTVVELAPSLMGRVVPAALAATMAARHERDGVTLRVGTGVEGIERAGGQARVVLTDGERIDGDVIVAGVGALPNVELAERTGLAVDNGIAADRHLRTSDPAIFAAGDCCSFPHPLFGDQRLRLEAWRNALDQADVVARNLLGAEEPYERVPWFWTDQYELSLHMAGLPHAATTTVERERADGVVLHFGLDDAGRLVAASGVAGGTAVARDIRLAELLIAGRAHPDPAALADPAVTLKSMTSSSRARSRDEGSR